MTQSRTHTCGELRLTDAGKRVTIVGWMENLREVGANFGLAVLREEPTEIAQLIMDYVRRHREITVDPTQWLHVLGVSEALPDR